MEVGVASVLCCLVLRSAEVGGFNLDPRIPIVKTAGADDLSYFGFSVAQHRTLRSRQYGESLLLVGAPRDQNLQPNTRRSGALWQCKLSADTQDCVQVATDGKRHVNRGNRTYGVYDGRLDHLNPPLESELKDGQWLGVEVQSQGEGGKVIVCAHRYTVRDVSRNSYDSKRGMLGLCYILEKDLSLPRNDNVGYKNVMVLRDAVGGKRLEPKGNFDDHAEWGVCQVGASATFVEASDISDESDLDLALFGAPGCFTWRGNVLAQNVGTVRRYELAVTHDSFRRFAKHGLMGLAVTSGRFFEGHVYYVSGAPHADATGQIYFFRKGGTDLLVPEWDRTLHGDAYGAGFGYSLATADTNGDGHPDLLVGAPFFDSDEGGGAVYLYLSENGNLNAKKRIKIKGSQPQCQFGLSLTAMGDLNSDGYADFAVGAPYEDNGGAVYVFLGGTNGLRLHGPDNEGPYLSASTVADQIIKGSDVAKRVPVVPRGLSTFGSSLSGGIDMDGNGYPDLLVGAYASNHVFLFRARPIIDITTYVDDRNLKGIDPGRSGCDADPSAEDACFDFSACFKVNRQIRGLRLSFHIEAEPQKPMSRVWLRLPGSEVGGNKSTVVTDTIVLGEGALGNHCTDIIGYVGSTHSDLQTPVQFAMSYSLVQSEPRMRYVRGAEVPDVDHFPILNQAQARKKFQATFEKDCGSDDICQAQLALRPTLRDRFKELGRTPAGDFYELELGSLEGSELVLDVNVENGLEPAYEAVLDVHFPPVIQYVGAGPDNMGVPELKNATWVSVSLGNPFKNSSRIQLRFSPQANMEDKLIVFYLATNTTSQQVYDSATFVNLVIVRRAEVKVVGGGFPEQLHYGGPVLGQSAMRDLAEVGPQVVHKFLVVNAGPSQLDVLTLHISWPFQVESGLPEGKWLLYLSEHPSLRNGRGVCTLPAGYTANPLNLTASGDISKGLSREYVPKLPKKRRKRRRVEQVVAPRIVEGPDGKQIKVITLDCDRGTARCLRIKCEVYNLPAKVPATIEVRARLWNSTLMEDYSSVDVVEIFTKATIMVDGDISQSVDDDYMSVRTVAYPDAARKRPLAIPEWWIILISVLAGLLVLVMISLILWKLGFFERKRPADDDSDLMMSAHFEKVRLNGDTS